MNSFDPYSRPPDDYDEFRQAMREHLPPSDEYPPRGTFPTSKNIMTPERSGTYQLDGDEWAEVSNGIGMSQERIIGVTTAKSGHGTWTERRTGGELFFSIGDAADFLRGKGARTQ